MAERIDKVLSRRAHGRTRRRLGGAVVASAVLHVVFVAAFIFLPGLVADRVEPIEFVAVQLVPLQALGTPEPPAREPRSEPPPRETPPPEPEPEPDPEPAQPDPEPTPRPSAPESRPRPAEERRPPEPQPVAPPPPAERQGSPFGVSTGTSTFGGTVGVDNPDFVYSYYIDQMLAIIGSYWVRPPVGGGVEATLHFRIGRQGEVSEVEIVRPSGHTTFDLAALRAIGQASPLPPLPASYRHDSLGINLIVQ